MPNTIPTTPQLDAATRAHNEALLAIGELLANFLDGAPPELARDAAEHLLTLGLEDVEDDNGEPVGARLLSRIDPEGDVR